MKTITLFELGYLDLIKALFFGKKLRIVLDKNQPVNSVVVRVESRDTKAETTDYFRRDVNGYDPLTNPDPNWHPGKNWLDPYHLNPFAENPFDRV